MSGTVGPRIPPFINTYSLDFDGMDDYIQTAASTSGDITLAGWVDCNGTYPSWTSFAPLSIRTSHANLINANLGRFYTFSTELRVTLQMSDQNGLNFSTYSIPLNLKGLGWKHFCWTFDNTTKQIYFYLDGVAQSWISYDGLTTTPYLTCPGYKYNSNLYIGGVTTSYSFNGYVDEVCLFDRIVTPTEIATLSTSPTVDLTPLNPLAWYRMGDNGAYKDPQWLIPSNENKDKVSNYSMDFDGVDSKMDVANNTTIGRTQNISYSIWVNLVSTTARQYIVGNGSSSNFGTRLSIETIGGNALVFQIGDSTNDSFFGSRVSNFGTLATPGTWNHILATWDGIDAKIYINGNLENTFSPTLPYTIEGWGPFRIGYRVDGFTGEAYKTNGKLDEISLFDTAISIGDVWDGSGQPIDVSGVSGITNYWKMGENATFAYNVNPDGTWTIPDEVGSSDGTSNNLMVDSARVGEAPGSSNNALSFNMDLIDRVEDTPPTP